MDESLYGKGYDHCMQSAGFTLKNLFIGSLILIFFVSLAITLSTQKAMAIDDLVVYDDALGNGWQDWSYNDRTIDLAATSPTYEGNHSVAVTYTDGWSGFMIGYSGAYLDVNAYDTFQFRIHGGTSGGQSITFTLAFEGSNIVQTISPQAGAWNLVEISLTDHSPREAYSIDFFNNTAGAQSTFYIDSMVFRDSGMPPPGEGPDLSIDAATDVHPISPYIYGMNFASADVAAAVRLPVRRWGGNSTTRYNWQIDVHNSGSDWFFENIPDTPGMIHDIVNQNLNTGSETILTMPLIGWTPKRRQSSHPYDCGFKVSVYGPQDSVDPWDTDCGNGEQGGSAITGNDPTDTSLTITPAFVTAWIENLITSFGSASNSGVMFYNLDNEPMLWNHTHRDVHPTAANYEEIRDSTYAYGAAIKAADASALTLGPVTWGWCAYFYSAADGCSAGSDHAAHNDTDFTAWYLSQMRDYEQAHGVRILDYLDLHIYPQISGVFSENLGSADVQAARLRSTRQLWDETYVHEGWIGQPVYLIPRMKEWVAEHYPGTKLAITEYNWGALGYINGALAQADILGIFGREGLDLATLWAPPDLTDPGTFAFLMYRNYDEAGKRFGDTSISAASTDQEDVAIYAAIRSSDGALTVMFINKTGDQLLSPVTLANFQPASQASVYRYSGDDITAIAHLPNLSIEKDGFIADLSAESITLVVIPPGLQSGCPADMEPDGDVDDDDLDVLAAGFGLTAVATDVDGDGDMDGVDLHQMAADFNRTDCLH